MRYTSLTTTISHDNNNHRTSKHASTSWRSDGDLSVRRASVARSLGAQSECCAISRCADQCVSMECADVPDVSTAERSDDLSKVVSRAEALRTVQAWVQHGRDGRRQQGPVSEMQVERNSISFSRVSVQCQLRWESLRVSRRLSGPGDINSRSFERSHL